MYDFVEDCEYWGYERYKSFAREELKYGLE